MRDLKSGAIGMISMNGRVELSLEGNIPQRKSQGMKTARSKQLEDN